MTIDESGILDPEFYGEAEALACLLADGVCIMGTADIGTDLYPFKTVTVSANVSDTFAWACADSEPLVFTDGEEGSDIIDLYKHWKENRVYGSTKWVCIKRNMKPQKPLADRMKQDNYWDDIMENLPDNTYDKKR